MENMVEVKHAILRKDTATALQKLEEGMTPVCDRMKLIKVADGSQFGWRTAEEYQQDYLASGSEDEKRLFRSERRAEQRIKQRHLVNRARYQTLKLIQNGSFEEREM